MKNLLKTSAILFLVLLATTSYASSFQYEIGKIANQKKVLLGLVAETSDNLQIKFYDERGKEIYTEKQENSTGFVRLYDLSKIETDKVVIEMKSSNATRTTTVDFKSTKAKSNFVAYFPHVSEKQLQVSHANASTSVNMKVRDNYGNKVYELDLPAKSAESFIANLEKLKSGVYEVELASEGKTFIKSVSIK